MAINLTRIERQILANQNKILKLLDEENKREYELNIEILERGFEREYESVINVYSDDEVKTHKVCKETVDILQMYRFINSAIGRLSKAEKKSLDLKRIEFEGFDGTHDPHYHYAKFMIEKLGKWEEYEGMGLNSHTQNSISKYRKMLKAMNERKSNNKLQLDKDDLEYIIKHA